jgi:hydroxymethylglutaryl-CoA reductase (NADPH)
MPTSSQKVRDFVQRRAGTRSETELRERLRPRTEALPARLPGGTALTAERVDARWKALRQPDSVRAEIADASSLGRLDAFARNIENFIGTVKVPVGIAGPLRVNGAFAHGDFHIPLATTEAALIASYDRGARVITEVGGCSAALLNEGVIRAPGYAFRALADAGEFVLWVTRETDALRAAAEATTHHGRLSDVRVTVEGNHVFLQLEFFTAAAAGQNMATIATDAVCNYIREHTPVQPEYSFVEANFSGDKKACALSFASVRGKKVAAEVRLPAALVERRLHSTPKRMEQFLRMATTGAMISGAFGVQGHYANGLAALYLATGQDVACVSESAVGITRLEVTDDGSLYASVTLPNIVVGTVGGGTGLPSQRACLELLGLHRPEDAPALGEVCAALALAGELSIIGALSAQEFTRAHARLARGRKPAAE